MGMRQTDSILFPILQASSWKLCQTLFTKLVILIVSSLNISVGGSWWFSVSTVLLSYSSAMWKTIIKPRGYPSAHLKLTNWLLTDSWFSRIYHTVNTSDSKIQQRDQQFLFFSLAHQCSVISAYFQSEVKPKYLSLLVVIIPACVCL